MRSSTKVRKGSAEIKLIFIFAIGTYLSLTILDCLVSTGAEANIAFEHATAGIVREYLSETGLELQVAHYYNVEGADTDLVHVDLQCTDGTCWSLSVDKDSGSVIPLKQPWKVE